MITYSEGKQHKPTGGGKVLRRKEENMIQTKHIFDTAHAANYDIAKAAANKAGMKFYSDYRANCFKCYHFEIIAETFDQDKILNNIILAVTAHQEQAAYRNKLTTYIAS